ncbi:hypothetical protein GCM10020331_025590 [Ectobacillus funiculus]
MGLSDEKDLVFLPVIERAVPYVRFFKKIWYTEKEMEGTLAMKKWMQLWLPVLLWVGMIFLFFSSQPYEKQDMRPTFAQYVDEHTVEKYFFLG